MKQLSSFIIVFVLTACDVAKDGVIENPFGPVTRRVILDSQVIVQYGSTSLAIFTLESGLTPPLHDCPQAKIQGMVVNPRENFTASDAKLEIHLRCLKCTGNNSRIFTLKITGTIEGSELSGQDAHGSIDGQEYLGMGITTGSKGTALISAIESESADCWA